MTVLINARVVLPGGQILTASKTVTVGGAPAVAPFGDVSRANSTATDIHTVDGIYIVSKAVRTYSSGSIVVPPVTDRPCTGSWKSMAGYSATIRNQYAQDDAIYWHEIDHHSDIGDITVAQWKADMVGKNITAFCLTAWCFNPASGKNPADYLFPGATHVWVDFDGISSATGYHDYSVELANVIAFCQAHGLTWGVAEFGANRATTTDPNGTARVQWVTTWLGNFRAAGAKKVLWWERTSQTNSCMDTPAEIACMKSLLAT